MKGKQCVRPATSVQKCSHVSDQARFLSTECWCDRRRDSFTEDPSQNSVPSLEVFKAGLDGFDGLDLVEGDWNLMVLRALST